MDFLRRILYGYGFSIIPSPIPPPPPPPTPLPTKARVQFQSKLMEIFHEYASGWVNYNWEWTSGIIHETHPKETVEAISANRYNVVDSDTYVSIGGDSVDGRTLRITPQIIDAKPDMDSTFQLSFTGPSGSGYGGGMHQQWEFNIPAFWSIFVGDYILASFDIAIHFGQDSWTPDQRRLDNWVWEIDVGDVFKNALPHFLSFRYVDSNIYKVIIKQVATLWRPGKLRFGFRLKMFWETNQPQHITIQSVISSTILSFTTGGRILNLVSSSVEQMPINAALSSLHSSFESIHDAVSDVTLTPENQATSS